jgi:tetratricopeptide (TPR) repeat protein
MKSERRHELQQNDLAVYLHRVNKSVEPYSRIIMVAVAVVAVGVLFFGFYRTQQSGQRSDATLQLIQAAASEDAEVLLSVTDNYPNTPAGAWAQLYRGKQYLSQGIQSLYNNRNNAEELLVDAQGAFKSAIGASDDQLLHSRAHYGVACAAESLGNLDEAIEAYREVIAVNESEAMVKKAEERIETLSNPQTKEFLAWFGDQDFAPADPSLPPSLPGGDSLPDLPDLKLPDLSLSSGGDEMELKDLDGGLEMPKESAGDQKPTESDARAAADPAAVTDGDSPQADQPAKEADASSEDNAKTKTDKDAAAGAEQAEATDGGSADKPAGDDASDS